MSKDIKQQATESNKIQPKTRTTLRDEFRKALSLEGKSKRTIEAYVDAITRFVVFSNGLYPIKATVNDIRAFLFHLKEERKLAARSYNQILYGLKSFFSIFMPDVPLMESFSRLKVKDGDYVFITRHEFEAMMRHTTNIKHQAIISVLYGTGIRVSECVGMTFGDLDRKEGLVRVRGKGDKIRYTLLPDTTLGILEKYYRACKPKNYVFEGRVGKALTTHMVEIAVRDAAQRAGIKKKSHLIV